MIAETTIGDGICMFGYAFMVIGIFWCLTRKGDGIKMFGDKNCQHKHYRETGITLLESGKIAGCQDDRVVMTTERSVCCCTQCGALFIPHFKIKTQVSVEESEASH